MIEGSCKIGDLNLKTLQELERLGPLAPEIQNPFFPSRPPSRIIAFSKSVI